MLIDLDEHGWLEFATDWGRHSFYLSRTELIELRDMINEEFD